MEEIEIVIDTEEIKEFFFQELLLRGFVPDLEELEELADICFDYFVSLGFIDDVEMYLAEEESDSEEDETP